MIIASSILHILYRGTSVLYTAREESASSILYIPREESAFYLAKTHSPLVLCRLKIATYIPQI